MAPKIKKVRELDLFKDIIPSIDEGLKELWNAATDVGKKEIKSDLWVLNRFISSVSNNDREMQEHYLLKVNELYNKHWFVLQKHPKLMWMLLCLTRHKSKTKKYHEYIPIKKHTDKKTEILLKLFPNMKMADIETLSAVITNEEIIEHCENLGWDKKQINEIGL